MSSRFSRRVKVPAWARKSRPRHPPEIKVAVPNMTLQVVERAMQLHGGGGVSQEFPLASMWAHSRTLRFADGPDEVHRRQIGRLELRKHG